MRDEHRMSTTDDPGPRPATRTFTVTISPSWLRAWGGRLIGATLLIVGAYIAMVPGARQAYGSTITGARVTDVRDVAAVVSWKSSVAETGSVSWAAASGGSCTGSSYSTTASDLRGSSTQSTVHYVKLENLAPSTLYCYRPVSGSSTGDAGTFTTGPTLGAPGSPDTQAGLITFGSVTATDTIVYATLTVGSLTSAPFSTLIRGVDQQGYFAFSLSSARTADLSSAFSATGATLNLTIEGGDKGTGVKTLVLATPASGASREVISAAFSGPTATPTSSPTVAPSATMTATMTSSPTMTPTATSTPVPPTPTSIPTATAVTLQFSPANAAVSPGGTVSVAIKAIVPPNLTIDSWTISVSYDKNVVSFVDGDCELGSASACGLVETGQGMVGIAGLGTSLTNTSSTFATMKFVAVGGVGSSTGLTVALDSELAVTSGNAFVQVKWIQDSATISISNAPTVNSYSPTSAWGGGGTVVTIRGTNFQAGATVKFGIRLASDVIVIDTSTITAKTPPVEVFGDVTGDGQVKLVDAICVLRKASKLVASLICPSDKISSSVLVTVINPEGQSAAGSASFTYEGADVTGDGFVKLVDAICVLRRATKLASTANCPNPQNYTPPAI